MDAGMSRAHTFKREFQMFKISDNGNGFHMTFANGRIVSVQFGEHAHSDGETNAEIASWKYRGAVRIWHEFPSGDSVEGWQKPDEVLAFMNMIAGYDDD